jgi:tetratricopeptide (TPR) repeat protein
MAWSQIEFQGNPDEDIAENYFKNGEFEKALVLYQKLNEEKNNTKYYYKIIETLQELQRYKEAQDLLLDRYNRSNYIPLLVEIGYNYQLQDSLDISNKYYEDAISVLDEKPVYVQTIARQFESHSLLEYAIRVYNKGMQLNPDKNYNIQLASIYGEQGDIESMFSNYLDYIEFKPDFLNNTKRIFSDFISENNDNENNIILKKLLLKKLQIQPEPIWNDLLSWLFVQEKDYKKSFAQEKALYKRNPESLDRIIELAVSAQNAKQYDIAIEIFNYTLVNSQDIRIQLIANQYLLEIETIQEQSNYNAINKKYLTLFDTYGMFEQTLPLQIAYGNFLAFYLHQPNEASTFLKQSLKLNLSPFQEATVKLKLGDILVFQEKFNEALIYYSQIQANLKNSTISQEARFKVAKTSYYKGDFDWAVSQLKILKSSTSQLIANDALDLKLLISDNLFEDSMMEDSLHTALKLYSKADLMAFQNKKEEAIELLNQIITEHKGNTIEDQALFMQAKLYEDKKQYDKAVTNYQIIISNFSDDILADDAYYFLAELYNNILLEPEKAKPLYEQIIFNHEDSIYFVEARKSYRMLRGDTIN